MSGRATWAWVVAVGFIRVAFSSFGSEMRPKQAVQVKSMRKLCILGGERSLTAICNSEERFSAPSDIDFFPDLHLENICFNALANISQTVSRNPYIRTSTLRTTTKSNPPSTCVHDNISDALATCSHNLLINLPPALVPRHLLPLQITNATPPSVPPLNPLNPHPPPHPYPNSHPPAPLLPLHHNPNPIHRPHSGQTLLTRPDTLLAQLTRRYGRRVDAGTLLVGGEFLWVCLPTPSLHSP